MKELRVYVVKDYTIEWDELHPENWHKEVFMQYAEDNGDVFTVDSFETYVNNGELKYNDAIRFIEVEAGEHPNPSKVIEDAKQVLNEVGYYISDAGAFSVEDVKGRAIENGYDNITHEQAVKCLELALRNEAVYETIWMAIDAAIETEATNE